MPVRVGINGFGRIGRNLFRAAAEAGAAAVAGQLVDSADARAGFALAAAAAGCGALAAARVR